VFPDLNIMDWQPGKKLQTSTGLRKSWVKEDLALPIRPNILPWVRSVWLKPPGQNFARIPDTERGKLRGNYLAAKTTENTLFSSLDSSI